MPLVPGKKAESCVGDGSKFVCADGSYSSSKKSCSSEDVSAENTADKKSSLPLKPPIDKPKGTGAANQAEIKRHGDILKLDYEGFTVWLDCSKRGAVKFQYNAQHDTGNQPRAEKFELDPNVPSECQQTSAASYSGKGANGETYDRGHQVPANHLDYSAVAIKQTNFMTNILPQAANMNRGAWLQTEEIIECYRDIDELLVIGGVIWGNNPKDDYFLSSHGVATPDAYWKVIVRGKGQDERAIAWIVPNSQAATRKNLDNYLVTIDELEKATGEKIPVADYAKHEKPKSSWPIPVGCNKS